MDEAALDAKTLDGGPAGGTDIVGQLLADIVERVAVFIHNVHNGHGRYIAGLKERLALSVDNGVVRVDLGVDKLLHNIGDAGHLGLEEVLQFGIIRQLIGVICPHAVVRFGDHRIAHLVDEFFAALHRVHDVITGHRDARLSVKLLHLAFILDAGHILHLKAAGDVPDRPRHSSPDC